MDGQKERPIKHTRQAGGEEGGEGESETGRGQGTRERTGVFRDKQLVVYFVDTRQREKDTDNACECFGICFMISSFRNGLKFVEKVRCGETGNVARG